MYLVKAVDALLNRITMYRLLVYGLGGILALGMVFSATHVLSLSVKGLLTSTVIILPICYLANRILGGLYHAARNNESWLITGFILCCILPPATTKSRIVGVAIAALLAMATKYILAWRHHHIFNPAAIAVFIVGWLGFTFASWWVGSPPMLPFTLLFGLLVVRKIHRFRLVLPFFAAALVMMLFVGLRQGDNARSILVTAFTSWPLVFFGTIMLTEPTTMPSSSRTQLFYGLVIGALFASQIRIGLVSTAPETVLVLGNIFVYANEPRRKLRLKLKTKQMLSGQLYDFAFEPDQPFSFKAGQYLEWTLPHRKVDGRGNRRSFTIASSPTEKELHLGVKFYEPSSSFKRALLAMQPGDTISADQLAGDFCLPRNAGEKLVFIAGGIGMTPFRSMLKQVIDAKEKRDITLFYVANTMEDVVYRDVIAEAAKDTGLNALCVITKGQLAPNAPGYEGHLTPEQLHESVPDYKERTFYISGPNAMVQAYKAMLTKAGVPRLHIITDFFSGY